VDVRQETASLVKSIIDELIHESVQLLTLNLVRSTGQITGRFRAGRLVYDYKIAGDNVAYTPIGGSERKDSAVCLNFSRETSQRLASRAYIMGLRDWSSTRADAWLCAKRTDGPKKCVKGTACGNSCIANGRTCRIKGNSQKLTQLKALLALPAAGQSSGSVTNTKQGFTKSQTGGKVKPESIAKLKSPVLRYWDVKSVQELARNKLFKMATAGDELDFKDRETWARLHRQFIGVPKSEQNQPDGPTVIRGLDVLKQFRPWYIFDLDPKTATTTDVKRAFIRLAKTHHPDHGGNPEVFQRLKVMRDSMLALMPSKNAK
jgi:hypothetical protein